MIETPSFRVYLSELKTVLKIEAYDVDDLEWVDVTDRLWAIKMAADMIAAEEMKK